jgi:hypothetical protein
MAACKGSHKASRRSGCISWRSCSRVSPRGDYGRATSLHLPNDVRQCLVSQRASAPVAHTVHPFFRVASLDGPVCSHSSIPGPPSPSAQGSERVRNRSPVPLPHRTQRGPRPLQRTSNSPCPATRRPLYACDGQPRCDCCLELDGRVKAWPIKHSTQAQQQAVTWAIWDGLAESTRIRS